MVQGKKRRADDVSIQIEEEIPLISHAGEDNDSPRDNPRYRAVRSYQKKMSDSNNEEPEEGEQIDPDEKFKSNSQIKVGKDYNPVSTTSLYQEEGAKPTALWSIWRHLYKNVPTNKTNFKK